MDGRSALGEPRPEGPTSFYLNSFEPSGTDLGVLQEADTRELLDRRPPAHDRPRLPAWCRPERPAPTLEDRSAAQLVGTSATAGPLAGAAVLEARYDPAIDLDLEGGASDRDAPVLVRGFVDGDQGTEVAVAVNGTVARQRPRSWKTTRSRCCSIPPSTRRGRTAWRSSASHGDDGSQARDGGGYRRWPDASTGL